MYIMVFVTTSSSDEAQLIAEHLLNLKLVACASETTAVTSRFWWQGHLDQVQERLLILKSREDLLAKIISEVQSQHSYDVPEVIALPILGGSSDYLKWLEHNLQPDSSDKSDY